MKVSLTKLKTKLKAVIKNRSHRICILITVACILLGAFLFRNSFYRLFEAFRDFGISFVYAFGADVTPTVNKPSAVGLQDLGLFPSDIDTFVIKLKLYGNLLITKDSFKIYGGGLARSLLIIVYIILLGLAVAVLLALLMLILLKRTNTDHNRDTKLLKIVKRIADFTYIPLKRGLANFFEFLKNKKHFAYWIIWIVIWCFNLNLATIFIEFCAYYFYVIGSFDFTNLYVQVYKLFLDLSVIIRAFPVWVWVIISIIIFDVWRRYHAHKKLKKLEENDEEFAKNLPVSNMIVAPMNMKKTTFLTELSITFNKVFRDVAYQKILENDLKFPNFPWINLELCIKHSINNHTIFNLATCELFIDAVRAVYERGDRYPKLKGVFLNQLKSKYGYNYSNLIFDYDVERYGFRYYDKLKPKTVFDVIKAYAKLYFIYVISCNLLLASFSIRTDDILKDKGNFPLWDIDFFKRDGKFMEAHSRHSHILDYDALRLGKKVCENSKFKDSIDFGIIAITEIGKERGNQKTQRGSNSDTEANQKNDLFGIDIKMCRHRATVDNFPFVVFITDEQRAESLNADERELGDVMRITDSSDFKIITPLFALDELIYIGATKLFTAFYKLDRHHKGNNTLLRRVIKALYGVIYRHYFNIYNMYSVSTLKLSVQNGKLDGKEKANKYKLSKKKIHSARFSTDAYSRFYYEKTVRSKVGIVDIPEYVGETASFEELKQQNSYFVKALQEAFISENDD